MTTKKNHTKNKSDVKQLAGILEQFSKEDIVLATKLLGLNVSSTLVNDTSASRYSCTSTIALDGQVSDLLKSIFVTIDRVTPYCRFRNDDGTYQCSIGIVSHLHLGISDRHYQAVGYLISRVNNSLRDGLLTIDNYHNLRIAKGHNLGEILYYGFYTPELAITPLVSHNIKWYGSEWVFTKEEKANLLKLVALGVAASVIAAEFGIPTLVAAVLLGVYAVIDACNLVGKGGCRIVTTWTGQTLILPNF